MGFYVRKALRAGPFRFNLSKSGVGVSVGVPGFRIGKGPRGNYIHAGRHGVYYRTTFQSFAPAPVAPGVPQSSPQLETSEIAMADITGTTATALAPTGPGDLIEQLNTAKRRLRLAPWAFALSVLVALPIISPSLVLSVVGSSADVGAIAVIAPFVLVPIALLTVWLWYWDNGRKAVVVFYEVSGDQAGLFQALVDDVTKLATVGGFWRMTSSGAVTTTYQHKVNAGASTVIRRSGATASLRGPSILRTNIAVPSIACGGDALYFLPDRVLVSDGAGFSDVSYDKLDVSVAPRRFIEDEQVPQDGRQVDTTWRFVNVRGGPDRRFNNNRQLPVMLYAQIEVRTANGLQWVLQVSRSDAAEGVTRDLQSFGRGTRSG